MTKTVRPDKKIHCKRKLVLEKTNSETRPEKKNGLIGKLHGMSMGSLQGTVPDP
jgi:hypothetical protein